MDEVDSRLELLQRRVSHVVSGRNPQVSGIYLIRLRLHLAVDVVVSQIVSGSLECGNVDGSIRKQRQVMLVLKHDPAQYYPADYFRTI